MNSVLICDDSPIARKMLARSLPPGLANSIQYAADGSEAIEIARSNSIDLLLLDLNMPNMNGYQVLQALRDEDISVMTVVISGDVQPQARQRIKALGALDFLAKPLHPPSLTRLLRQYGLIDAFTEATEHQSVSNAKACTVESVDQQLHLQEVVNVAMGQAGASLSRLLNNFVELPVPNVRKVATSSLASSLRRYEASPCTAVTQGFSGADVHGEAILLLSDSSVPPLNKLLAAASDSTDPAVDLVFDVAAILTGACLEGLSNQLDIEFSCASPVLLGRHRTLAAMLSCSQTGDLLLVELNYQLLDGEIECTLVLLITEPSLPALWDRLELLQ